MITENFAQQGWQCPICKRVYSPLTMMCYYCGAEGITRTSTGTGTGTSSDWVKHQKEPSSFTDTSTGYATYTTGDMRCDYCKHNAGIFCGNGTMEYSGVCKKCVNKDMWEAKENET